MPRHLCSKLREVSGCLATCTATSRGSQEALRYCRRSCLATHTTNSRGFQEMGAFNLPCARVRTVPALLRVVPGLPLRGHAGASEPPSRNPKRARVAQGVPAPTDVRCAEAAVRDAHPRHQFSIVHAPRNEVRQGDCRAEQSRLSPKVPNSVHEVHSHGDVGFPISVDAANRVERLQLGRVAVNVPNIHRGCLRFPTAQIQGRRARTDVSTRLLWQLEVASPLPLCKTDVPVRGG